MDVALEPLYESAPVAGHVAAGATELAPAPEAGATGVVSASPAVGAAGFDLRPWDGAPAAEQLGIALARVVDAARGGLTDATVIMPIGGDILHEVAKLRALRRLVARVAELVGEPLTLTLHATGAPRTAAPDLAANLIHNSAIVFAALVGGADRVSPLAFSDAPEHERLADNVARLGLHEAHLAAVADPAAGSYALEALTEALCERAWAVFQERGA